MSIAVWCMHSTCAYAWMEILPMFKPVMISYGYAHLHLHRLGLVAEITLVAILLLVVLYGECWKYFKPPTDARIKFCQAFVFPHLDYCSCIWGSAQLGRLFKLQKRAARMIYDLPTRTPTKPLLKKLRWILLTDRVQYRYGIPNGIQIPQGSFHNTWQKCI